MPDDRRRPSRINLRVPSADPVPVEIDPDDTPPPREPPSLLDVDGFADLPEAIQAALLQLHDTQREHDVAFTRLWDARHMRDELGSMRQSTAAILQQIGLLASMPALLQQQAVQVAQLVTWRETLEKRDRRLEQTLDALDKRLDATEFSQIKLEQSIAALGREIGDGFRSNAKSFAQHERELEDLADHVDQVETEHEKRIRSLEDTRTAATAKISALAAIAAVLVMFIGWLGKLAIDHLKK